MKLLIPFVFLLILCSCSHEDPVPKGRILIKNDLRDKDYNILQVTGEGISFSLKAGESKLLPAGSTKFSFRRDYENYRREYSVSCPDFTSSSEGISVKTIDVHSNRIAGGCKTVYAAKID